MAAFDLDMDKKEDLIVGAPLEREGSEERSGAIYIFYGNDDLR